MPTETTIQPLIPRAARNGEAAVPLSTVLSLAFLGSLGTGIVTTGIYFLTKESFHFSRDANFGLGLLQGVTYVAGAMAAGPGVRWARRTFGVSTRAVLVAILVVLGVLCALPWAGGRLGPSSAWTVWLMIGLYSPITGTLWPIVEGYLSGGRSGTSLRSALGAFNVTWAGAIVVGLASIGRLVEHHAVELLLGLGGLHLLTLVVVARLPREPGRHPEEHHDPHPPVYLGLLSTFRVLLPTSYVVSTALGPYLPTALSNLGVAKDWQTPIASSWSAARVVVFLVLTRWHGWHGRWYPAVLAMIVLLGGFATAVLAPVLLTGTVGVAATIAGLVLFGMGMATVYTAALYYAMEVGKAEVDAGGTHEALIGVGYSIGPVCGLASGGLVMAAASSDRVFAPTMVVIVAVVALIGVGVAWRKATRAIRSA
ncbi:MAG: MFS transporter [Phycisphaerales bacterium]